MERLGSLLVSSLSLEELGFLGREEWPAWVFLGLGMVPSSESGMLPSEKLCFPSLPVSDLLKALSATSPFGTVRSDVGRDH